MADNSAQNATDTIATDELVTLNGGASTLVKVQRVKPGFGVDGDFRDVSAGFPMPTMTPDVSASGVLAALNATQVLALNGASGAAAQISGTWVGTITFEGTLDGTSWFPVNAVSASTSSPQTTTTVNGLYRLTPGGLSSIRANMTAFTSGSASVVLRASSGVGGTFANQILPTKNTDGTSSQSIKAASTAVALTDQSAVVQDANLGNQADASATTDAGTFSLIALFKRLLGKLSTQLPAALGSTSSAASLPVALSTDSASGSITTQNLVPGGAATAGSAIEVTLNGACSLGIQVTGTYTGALSLQATLDGTAWVTLGGSPFINVNTGANLSTITSALQSVFQADVGGFVKARITGLAAMTGAAVVTLRSTANPSMVALDAALPTGTNSIGNIGTVSTVSTVTSVSATTPAATTTTAATLSSAATTNATSIKASPGSLYSVTASNVGAAAAFLKIFNLATAPTVGTSVPFLTIPIAASGVANINFGAQGMRMSAGISFSITMLVADADTTAIAAGQVKVAIAYI